jgi:ornithine cyclodeaminase/alanine dehydrogenase-like protein (mu-crystallin family)
VRPIEQVYVVGRRADAAQAFAAEVTAATGLPAEPVDARTGVVARSGFALQDLTLAAALLRRRAASPETLNDHCGHPRSP